jgi:hypothetical protein
VQVQRVRGELACGAPQPSCSLTCQNARLWAFQTADASDARRDAPD